MSGAKTPKIERNFDWDAIERDYRTDLYSNRELSRKYGPSESRIRAKAKGKPEKGIPPWTKDLSDKIKVRIAAELQRKAAPAGSSDDQVVQQAALQGVVVLERHRADLGKARDLIAGMFDEIGTQAELNDAELQKLIAALPQELHPTAILAHRATTLHARQKNVSGLIASLARIIPLERQAYGLENGEGDEPSGNELTPEAREALDAIYDKG